MPTNVNALAIEEQADHLVVTVHMPVPQLTEGDQTPREHRIVIPREALANRQQLYSLADGWEALVAILKEHAKRLNALPDTDDHTDPRINGLGGLRRDVEVTLSQDVALVSQEVLAGRPSVA